MAGAKEIKSRIRSVKNTRKITRTMEMVSTAKSKKMVDRVNAAKPYGNKLQEIMESLSEGGGAIESPFLRKAENPSKVVLLVITANRGLCGGYNTNVLKIAKHRIQELQSAGVAFELHVVGKKGIAFFKFQKIEVTKTYLSKEDMLTFEDSLEFSEKFMDRFVLGEIDRVEVVSTVYLSSASQMPDLSIILPVGEISETERQKREREKKKEDTESKGNTTGPVIYDPDPEAILSSLIPHLIKAHLYRLMLEAATAEQIYRRVAMKSATDAAGEMNKMLNRKYNRIRQASITQEISEIVAGADSV